MSDIEKMKNNMEELAMINDHIIAAKKTQRLFEDNHRPEGVKACDDMLDAMYKRAGELFREVISCES